ncbi:MAG: deoxynucleoside kinase, partial [Candidatus Micrarchaeota archaeon]|nr:deoxynucleoside kinase [Candidatus Micrarchaeota archaeon]
SGIDKEWLIALNSKFPMPDITIILDIDPKVALKRVDGRKNGKEIFEELEFQKRVHDAYMELKSSYKNYFIIDASKSEKEVSEQINRIVGKHYP